MKEMFQLKQQFGKNVKKYPEESTSLNLNRERPGRRKKARSEKNITNVRQFLHDDAHVTGGRNPLQISQVTFQRICKLNIK